MYPYYILVLLPGILSLIRFKWPDAKKQKQIAIILFFSLLFLMVALRARTVGVDTPNYLIKFRQIQRLSFGKVFDFTSEPAYNLLNKIVLLFTDNFQVLLVVVALISIVPIAWLYARESEIPILTITLFLMQSNFIVLFSGLRQSIAVSLGIIAYELVRRKKLIFFLIIVLIAFWFHNSAFMLLFMYPLYHVRITRIKVLFVVPVMLVLLAFNRPIFLFLQRFISSYYASGIQETGAYMMLIVFTFFAVISYVLPDEKKIDADTGGMRNFLLLVIVIQTFASIHPLAMRMGYYYMIFIPLLIPKIITRSTVWRQFAMVAAVGMTVIFMLYFFVKFPADNTLHTFPYHFFWEVNA